MYLIVVGVLCLSYLPMSSSVRNQLLSHYQDQVRQTFDKSIDLFEGSLGQLYNTSDIASSSPYYRECATAGTSAKSEEKLPKLYMASKVLCSYLSTVSLADASFVVFPTIDAVIDSRQVYLDSESFVQYGLSIGGMTPAEASSLLVSSAENRLLERVSVYGKAEQPALMLLFKNFHSPVRTGAIYLESTLQDLFHLYTLPEESELLITDSAGNMLYSYGEANEAVAYTRKTGFLSLCVTLRVPERHFNALLQSFDGMLRATLSAAGLVGLLLSIAFALINYLPVRRLVSLSRGGGEQKRKNEYSILYESIKSSNTRISNLSTHVTALEESLRSNLFARLLNGSIHTKAELDLCEEVLPVLKKECLLALVRLDGGEAGEGGFSFLLPLRGKGFYLQQIDYRQIALLFQAEAMAAQCVTLILEKQTARCCMGVSDAFSGAQALHTAYYHAQLAAACGQPVNYFCAAPETLRRSTMDFSALQRIYELLSAGEIEAVEKAIRSAGETLRFQASGREECVQLCGVLHFAFEMALADLRIDALERPLHDVQELIAMNVADMFEALVADARLIGKKAREMRTQRSNGTHVAVLDYIRHNFAQPDLYAASIAQAMGVTANFVYQTVREGTGRSLGDYIEELRLDQACSLLTETNEPIKEISESCGWLIQATFYRIFKQRYGITPSQYRKQHGEAQNP